MSRWLRLHLHQAHKSDRPAEPYVGRQECFFQLTGAQVQLAVLKVLPLYQPAHEAALTAKLGGPLQKLPSSLFGCLPDVCVCSLPKRPLRQGKQFCTPRTRATACNQQPAQQWLQRPQCLVDILPAGTDVRQVVNGYQLHVLSWRCSIPSLKRWVAAPWVQKSRHVLVLDVRTLFHLRHRRGTGPTAFHGWVPVSRIAAPVAILTTRSQT